ncbi:bladder cancer-associated protein isoform X1 [Papio anubis]|uniref:bladder cancer-associated protein isoform X1 n=1 Tax=Papio anubis TaxID=9555 RepID=UPI0012AE2135|nr:bladder cancer-associated protein isoform X1 [Papio anubis]
MGPRPAPLEDEGGVSPASCGVRGELRWRQAAADGDSGGGAMAGLAELEASRTGGCQLDLAIHIGKVHFIISLSKFCEQNICWKSEKNCIEGEINNFRVSVLPIYGHGVYLLLIRIVFVLFCFVFNAF